MLRKSSADDPSRPSGLEIQRLVGIVYPKRKPRGFDELSYLSTYFDTIEINTSYYGAPRATTAKKRVESVGQNGAFRFTAKLFHSFTHERQAASNDERDFKDGLSPIMEANRLGAVLMQFPWSFRNSPENREYLVTLHKRFSEFPLVLEVRDASWLEEDIFELLSQLGIGFCNIDQPLFKSSIKPSAHLTSGIGYVRLHGRNYKHWFSKEADVRERYDHLYSLDELDPWVARMRQIAEDAADTYVVTNNHYLGQAVSNAIEITSILKGQPVPAPPEVVERYPELKDFTQGRSEGPGEAKQQ
jgi:uncharacterized protein YecE (DUF72 family)